MARTILITGGCRSGKSAHAQRLAESLGARRFYIATCPVTDEEMQARIARHQQERRQHNWETIEEQTDLAGAIGRVSCEAVALVDCLTLWINNLMHEADRAGESFGEDEMEDLSRQVLDACSGRIQPTIFVTNEVGMGIVPDNTASRRYRDLVGRCNQVMAAGVDEVRLVVCGIPSILKGEANRVTS